MVYTYMQMPVHMCTRFIRLAVCQSHNSICNRLTLCSSWRNRSCSPAELLEPASAVHSLSKETV